MSLTLPIITTIIVLAFLAFKFLYGRRKGFFRILFTTFSLVVTIVIASLLTKPVASLLQEHTFVGTSVENTISDYLDKRFEEKEEAAEEKEDEFIDSLSIPQFLKSAISDNNTLTKYRDLGITTFKEYLTVQLTGISMKAIAFVLLSIILYIALRVIAHVMDIIARLPILHGANKLLGGLLGLLEGLLIIWCVMIFIMMFNGSGFGSTCMDIINESPVLKFIYDHNLPVMLFHALLGSL